MSPPAAAPTLSDALPENVRRIIDGLLAAARETLGPDLTSVVLFGSAAEGQLRATSDVNIIFVLARFEARAIDALRDVFRDAHAAVKLEPMFLLASEIGPAVQAFSVKFADILRRRQVIYGADPFANLTVSRAAEIVRLNQVLLNLALRLRERYVLVSPREEQAALVIADAVGPLRSFAATLLELEDRPAPTPKEALARVAAELPAGSGPPWVETLGHLSQVREERVLPPGVAPPTLLRLVDLAVAMRARVERLA